MFIKRVYLTCLKCKDAPIYNKYINIIIKGIGNVFEFLLRNYLVYLKNIVLVKYMRCFMYNFYKNFSAFNRRECF